MTERGAGTNDAWNLPDDLFITEELARRSSSHSNLEAEVAALRLIARRMATTPSALLSQFVELAMDLTHASSCGLALLQRTDPPSLVWRHLHGTLQPYDNIETGRVQALAEIVSRAEGSWLLSHLERVFEWMRSNGLSLPEALAVPLRINGEYAGTLLVASSDAPHFNDEHARLLSELSEFVGIALHVTGQLDSLRASLDHQEIIAAEMRHRLKNVFAVADGMIRASAKSAAPPDAMVEALTGRLHALERAHSLLRLARADPSAPSVATDLQNLLAEITKPHCLFAQQGPVAVTLSGPTTLCGEHATNGIALVIHELATNAAKYGALSRAGRSVDVRWNIDDGSLLLCWSERGAPPVSKVPVPKGFGTTLVDRTIKTQFHGAIERYWTSHGLSIRMQLALLRLKT